MKPHDKLTIIRNLHRSRELRIFRDQVEAWFVRSERDVNDLPMDWEGAQAARSRINQMLPRILQIVQAAGLGSGAGTPVVTDPGVPVGRVEVLQRIFTARLGDGVDQEILDLLDMAMGVYEGGRFQALTRTFNPFHYAATALGYLARLPRKALAALGLLHPVRTPGVRGSSSESDSALLREAEDLIDARVAALQDRQALRQAELSRQVAELAERLDFAERVLAQRQAPRQLEAPQESDYHTPV